MLSKAVVKVRLKNTQRSAGYAWGSDTLREALVMREAVFFIMQQADPKFEPAQQLVLEVLRVAEEQTAGAAEV